MDTKRIPEAFHPGEYLRDELEAREWTQADLSAILSYPPTIVSDIITGRRSISAENAAALADAFGTSAQLWLNLQAAYQLARETSKDEMISRRARLYNKAPIREMIRRGWFEDSSSIEVLETQVCQFFEIDRIEDPVSLHHAARKSTDYGNVTVLQLAWLARARQLARALEVERPYDAENFDSLMVELADLRSEVSDAGYVPTVMSKYGIRCIVLEQFPGSKMDGACLWLDSDPTKPVVVVSLRYDRLDFFWHTLCHELAHVKTQEGLENPLIEIAMIGRDAQQEKQNKERKADEFAVRFLVDQKELEHFVERKHPLYSKKEIVVFASSVRTHPGIVVGQLQHRGHIPYTHLRALLVSVKDVITRTALTDGWGRTVRAA